MMFVTVGDVLVKDSPRTCFMEVQECGQFRGHVIVSECVFGLFVDLNNT